MIKRNIYLLCWQTSRPINSVAIKDTPIVSVFRVSKCNSFHERSGWQNEPLSWPTVIFMLSLPHILNAGKMWGSCSAMMQWNIHRHTRVWPLHRKKNENMCGLYQWISFYCFPEVLQIKGMIQNKEGEGWWFY